MCQSDGRHDSNTDPLNLRCWDQKGCFGYDFMYPPERYVNALRNSQLCTSNPDLSLGACPPEDIHPHPLFVFGGVGRSPEQVILGGIIGLRWQDIAVDREHEELRYLRGDQIPWSALVGGVDGPVNNPRMRESRDPRSGLPGPAAAYMAAPISGHEHEMMDSLQYSCIFPVPTPQLCLDSSTTGCDCRDSELTRNPLCQAADGSCSCSPGPRPIPDLVTCRYCRGWAKAESLRPFARGTSMMIRARTTATIQRSMPLSSAWRFSWEVAVWFRTLPWCPTGKGARSGL